MSEDRRAIPDDFEVTRCDLPGFVGDFTQMDYGEPLTPRVVKLREESRLDAALDYYARLNLGRWTWLDERCLPGFVSHFAPGCGGIMTSNRDDL